MGRKEKENREIKNRNKEKTKKRNKMTDLKI